MTGDPPRAFIQACKDVQSGRVSMTYAADSLGWSLGLFRYCARALRTFEHRADMDCWCEPRHDSVCHDVIIHWTLDDEEDDQ